MNDTLMSKRDREQLPSSVQHALDVLEAVGWDICGPSAKESLACCAAAVNKYHPVRLLKYVGIQCGDDYAWGAVYGPDLFYDYGRTPAEALTGLSDEIKKEAGLVGNLSAKLLEEK